jgi:hypothetical protein
MVDVMWNGQRWVCSRVVNVEACRIPTNCVTLYDRVKGCIIMHKNECIYIQRVSDEAGDTYWEGTGTSC